MTLRRGLLPILAALGLLSIAAGGVVLAYESVRPESPSELENVARDAFASCGEETEAVAELHFRAQVASDVLFDPAAHLPQSHRFARGDLLALRRWEEECAVPETPIEDPRLSKAVRWAEVRCGEPMPADFFRTPPYLHPSGRSYVALAVGHAVAGSADPQWRLEHLPFAHVLEWDALTGVAPLDPARAALVELDWESLERATRSPGLVLTPSFVLECAPSTSPIREPRCDVRERGPWQECVANAGLVPGADRAHCEVVVAGVCFAAAPGLPPALGGGLLVLGALLLVVVAGRFAWLAERERERVSEGRVLALRTLSHEMRTPLTSLAISLEEIRSAFDALPEASQLAFLEVCESVERMRATIALAADYVSASAAGKNPHSCEETTLAEIAEDVVQGLDASVEVEVKGDGVFLVDRRWLQVCLRNLLENAIIHGAPPVRLEAERRGDGIRFVVSDGGDLTEGDLPGLMLPHRSSRDSLGLGLAIVDRAARALGGTLRVEVHPTRFILSLPLPSDASRPAH